MHTQGIRNWYKLGAGVRARPWWSDWLHLSGPEESIQWPQGTGHSNCVDQQTLLRTLAFSVNLRTHIKHRGIHTNTHACCLRPSMGSSLRWKQTLFSACYGGGSLLHMWVMCLRAQSAGLSSPAERIAVRAEENCVILVPQEPSVWKPVRRNILIRLQVCGNHRSPFCGRALSCIDAALHVCGPVWS